MFPPKRGLDGQAGVIAVGLLRKSWRPPSSHELPFGHRPGPSG
jgi:hypothetical protein